MADILVSIGDFLATLGQIVLTFIEDIVYIVKLTGAILLRVPMYFSWMPSEAVILIGILFSIVVIYKVLGREG